uniref:Putative LAGLIDADG homing endonuclease n=1 Tax=Pycnoporellus fulgens TaxID=202718 RepID=H1ZWQ7_9APHY|nr:putative LAGLIDADG homing endonuclease [Pycnoporellus fulgens]
MANKTLFNLWLEWFVGFCDADANFQVFPKKRIYQTKDNKVTEYYNIGYGFHIGLSIKDLPLLEKIQNQFNGIGHIYSYPSRDEARWAVTKKTELKYLIQTVFEKHPLITQHQSERYARLRYGLLNNFIRVETIEEYNQFLLKNFVAACGKEITDSYYTEGTSFDNWIIGFINGEGSFYIHSRRLRRVFNIEHTDKNALELIKKRLDLTPNVLDKGNRNNTRKNTFSLTISSKKDISSIRELCENPSLNKLEGQKLLQYNNWKVNS